MDTFWIAIVVALIIVLPTLVAPGAYLLEQRLATKYEQRYGRRWPMARE
jgi:hypothetical protein